MLFDEEEIEVYNSIEEALNADSPVKVLRLEGQMLRELPPEIGELSDLEELYLGPEMNFRGEGERNFLATLPGTIAKLKNLRVLDLSENNMSEVPEAINELESLEELDLSGNPLGELPAWFGEMSSMTGLKLINNSIEEIRILPPNLEDLTIHSMGLRMDARILFGLSRMMNLYIYDADMDPAEVPETIAKMGSLLSLELVNCNILELPARLPETLRKVNLYGNHLRAFPDCLRELPNLEVLDLGENDLTMLGGEVKLPKLLELNLYYNKIERISDKVFLGLDSLRQLMMGGNKLERFSVPDWVLEKILVLDLSKNSIHTVDIGDMSLGSLKVLKLDHNQLSAVPWNLPGGLEELDLRNNRIKDLAGIEEGRAPKKVYLMGNEVPKETWDDIQKRFPGASISFTKGPDHAGVPTWQNFTVQ